LLAACTPAAGSEAEAIRLWAMGREGEVVAQLMPEFERENPGVRVRVQQIPWTAAHEKLLTAFVGDATPDIAMLGNTWVPEFEALGALEPLDPYVAASRSLAPEDFFAGVWNTNVVHDTVYGVPWYVDTRVLFYRTDLLEAAGYDSVPATWAEWRTAMERIKARMGPRQYPILVPTNEWPPPVILGLQAGAPLLRDDGMYAWFTDPRFRQAFDFYVGLFNDGLAPKVSGAEVSNLYQEFARGNIAMYISGPWQIGEFRSRIPAAMQDTWMTAPLPGPDGPGVSMAGGASLVIFRGSDHKADAWKLAEYLSRPDVQLRFYELTGDLPTHRDAWNDTTLANNRHARAFRTQLDRVVPLPKVPEWEQIATKVFEYGEQAVRGRRTVDQTLTALDRDVNGLLEKRRWMAARAEERRTTGAPGAAP
ncbi:MAG: transporter substrate-binding protein, partial [Geminicoccaceae bacterium]|nr:transporter substrate-binding protein [Geminicoccaceae bacterium]